MNNDQPAHKRIDAGIKRGKRQKMPIAANRISQDRSAVPGEGVIANISTERVIARLIAGETSTQIAASYGVTRQGLGWFMRNNSEEDWRQALVIQAFERKEKADEELDLIRDPLSLARAREQLRSAQWDLERLLTKFFGVKQEVTGKDGGPLQVQIVRFGQTIEGQSSVVSTPQEVNAALLQPIITKPVTDGGS